MVRRTDAWVGSLVGGGWVRMALMYLFTASLPEACGGLAARDREAAATAVRQGCPQHTRPAEGGVQPNAALAPARAGNGMHAVAVAACFQTA